MALEAATFINGLVASNPVASDLQSQGDDHLRLIKQVLQNTFPNGDAAIYRPTAVGEIAGNYTLGTTDNGELFAVNASAASRTITFPASAADRYTIHIVKVDSSANTVTLTTAGVMNGGTSVILRNQWDYAVATYSVPDSEWYVTVKSRQLVAPIATSTDLTLSNLHLGTLLQVSASAANRTITLPNTLPAGFWVEVRKTDSTANTVTLDATSGGQINGANTVTLKYQFETYRLWWDGTTWSMPVFDNIPPGATMMWWFNTAPTGWTLVEGQAISRTGNPRLFAQFGTTYGAGDGSTTFNLPNPKGRFPRVWANGSTNDPDRASRTAPAGSSITAGDNVGTEQGYQIQSHQHDQTQSSGGTLNGTNALTPTLYNSGNTLTGATGGNETRPINFNVALIMKLG